MSEIIKKEKLITSGFVFSFASSFLLFFAFYLILPILPLYLKDSYNASDSLIGIILSSYTLTALAIRPFGGFLVDRFARKPFLILCYFTFIAFFAGYIIASSLMFFAILRASHGLSFGMVTTSNSTVAIDIMPSSRRNEGIGYFGISVNLAMALGPMISLYIYECWNNYQYVFWASLISGAVGLICASMIKIPHKDIATTTEINHTATEKEVISLDRFFLLKALPGAIALSLISFTYGLLSTYVAVYARNEVGLTSGAGMFFIAMSVGLISSRLLTYRMMAKGELNRIIIIGIILLITSMSSFVFIQNKMSFYVSATIIGLAFGYISPAFQAMFINLAPHKRRGTANSTYYIAYDTGIGIGVLVGGQIAQVSNYSMAYMFGLGLVILSLIMFKFISAPYYTRHKINN